jgi:hypothetical protein
MMTGGCGSIGAACISKLDIGEPRAEGEDSIPPRKRLRTGRVRQASLLNGMSRNSNVL